MTVTLSSADLHGILLELQAMNATLSKILDEIKGDFSDEDSAILAATAKVQAETEKISGEGTTP